MDLIIPPHNVLSHLDDVLPVGAVGLDPVDAVVLVLLKVHPVDPVLGHMCIQVKDVVT